MGLFVKKPVDAGRGDEKAGKVLSCVLILTSWELRKQLLGKLQRLMSRRSSGVENWTVERIFESRGLTLDAFRINQELNNHISQRKRSFRYEG